MTKISTYVVDDKVTALDKWIGSDANMQNKTKNFTPKKLAAYFNEDQVINIGVPLQYKYYTLDPLEARPNGTLTFETEIGPTVNFSTITTFLLSKYTTKQNIVSDFLNFLDGSKVLLFKSSDINSFGFYRISNIEPYEPDPNFFVVTVEYETGNGFMEEDKDYMLSLVSLAGDFIPTKTSELINDGDDGTNPFISEEDINRAEWDEAYEGKINSAEVTGTSTKTLTLTKEDGSTILASWTDEDTGKVTSVFGRDGDVVAESGDYNTGQVTEVANKKYQTDNQALFNDATSSIQTQLNNKANDNDVVHKTGNESILGLKSFTQTSINRSGLLLDNSSDLYNSIKIYNRGLNDGIEINNTSQGGGILVANTGGFSSHAIYLTNTSEGNALIINNSGTGTDNAGNGIYALNSNSGAMFRGVNISSGPSIILESSLSSTGTPFEITRNGSSQLKINNIGEVTANKFIKLGGTSLQYLMADGTVSTGPILTGYVPYIGANANVALGEYGIGAGYFTFDTTPTNIPTDQGTMYWDVAKSTVSLIMNGTIQHIGQDSFYYAKNSSGSSIPKGTAVRFAGTDGASGHILITPMIANGTVPSSYYMGITSETIANGAFGQVMAFGELEGVNTSSYTAGALLYVSTTVAGGFQTTVPIAPNNIILAAATLNSKNNGALIVRATLGSNINNDEGVKIVAPTTGDLLQLQSNGLWENKSVFSLGLVPQSRTLTINGTSFDLSTNRSWNVGTVTSVGLTSATSGVTIGSSPITTSGNITLAIATASASQQGLLSSTDWTTFNNKQPAGDYITSLTGEVTASGPGAASSILNNASVTGKILSGVNITGGTILDTDTMLTAFGKLQNQINSLIGGSIYQGVWNASTNTPTLTSSVGVDGNYYIVNVAGSTNLNGITDWKVGDWAIFHGGTWQKVDNTDAVSSVNGFTGAVSLTTDNIPEGVTNQYFLNSRARAALSFAAGSGAYNSTTGVITIPTNNNQITNGSNFITLSSLSGSAPIQYNNTTGAISITQAGTSSNGFLSSTDWNTFNNKQNALTNPVTGTGGENEIAFFSSTGSTITSSPSVKIVGPELQTTLLKVTTFGAGMVYSDSSGSTGTLTGTTNALTYWSSPGTIGSLSTATYPNLTELSYVKGVTSSIQSQLNSKVSSQWVTSGSNIYYNTGYVGIGTTAPAEILHLQSSQPVIRYTKTGILNWKVGVISGNTFTINTDASGGDAFNITSGGNVGIGTTTFDLYGYGNFISNQGSNKVIYYDSNNFIGNQFTSNSSTLNFATVNALGSPTIINKIVSTTSSAANNSESGYLSFFTKSGNVSELSTERMRITSGGNVGIGTTTTPVKLVVDGGSGDYTPIWAKSSLLASSKYFGSLLAGYALTINQSAQFGYVYDTVTPTNSFAHITPFGSAEGSRFMVRADGNVGIGTTSPAVRLDVNGVIRAKSGAFRGGGYRFDYYTESTSSRNWLITTDELAYGDFSILSSSTQTGDVNLTRLYINPSGNVGIGTSNAQLKTTIRSSDAPDLPTLGVASGHLLMGNGATNVDYGLMFGVNGYGSTWIQSQRVDGPATAYNILLQPRGGNVLIGTDTDSGYKLSVNGSGRFFVPSASSSSPTIMLSQAGLYANIAGAGDMYHGLILRGIPANYTDYAVTAGDYMSFYEYGGDFRFYKKDVSSLDLLARITSSGITATGFFNSSDIRLKDIISQDGDVIRYKWKDGRDDKIHVGYSAQEVQKVMPDAVNEGEDGMLSVNYIEVLVAKIAELENRIKQLEK